MKDVLRQLLEAEGAGRLAAREKEAEAEGILNEAAELGRQIAEESRLRAGRDIEELKRTANESTVRMKQEIDEQSAASLDQVDSQAQRNRAVAVERVVALLLGES